MRIYRSAAEFRLGDARRMYMTAAQLRTRQIVPLESNCRIHAATKTGDPAAFQSLYTTRLQYEDSSMYSDSMRSIGASHVSSRAPEREFSVPASCV